MCTYNPLCLSRDGSCNCSRMKSQEEIHNPFPIGLYQQDNSTFMYSMFRMMMEQSEIIKGAYEQTRQVLEKLLESNSTPSKPKPVPDTIEGEETSKAGLLNYLCGPKLSFTHFLCLNEDISLPLYKERCFSVSINIVNSSGAKAVLPRPVLFKAFLYTTESPPKLVTTNTSGDKAMRGTLEVESDSHVLFKKIIIKEVTSHFRNGVLYFVIMPQNADFIKPLIIEDFVIKARKLISKKTCKKAKNIEEEESEERYDEEEIEKQ
ncbi:hypothetical protein SteCoe_34483 [Stentor coeruleus]|uniref:Uncharacterized protein n=1 Tax=Stentor coeruleus TaxID=5963 RepID=A0A1R2AUL1_9CILI|nr:hypothetical protein SteCoe_34483 [Stentor coeruleus]